jgi:TPP-dependent pyruvate/acetoin dehydrogenase alpha subunit
MTTAPDTTSRLDAALLLDLYRRMLLIRRFEERSNALFMQGRIPSTLHLYIGQEAVAVGVCSVLRTDDVITSTHRPHGHALAKGVTPRSIMAELMGKATGCCKGKGSSMHVGDMSVGMPPAIAIVGGGAPIAAGAALSAKMRGTDGVAVCFMGDGAANEGAVHEAMNMAGIWRLPIVFVCENNLYGASTSIAAAFPIERISSRAAAYGFVGDTVDGNDVMAVREASSAAVERARRGEGATFLECVTYRLCGHSRSDACNYRPDDEEAEWREKDPLPAFQRRYAAAGGPIATAELQCIEKEVAATIDEAVAFADESPAPVLADLMTDVYWEGR